MVWNNLCDCLSFYHLWVIQKACSPARKTCMAPHNVFFSLCLISRQAVFNAILKLSWMTWGGESLIRTLGLPISNLWKSDQTKNSSHSQGKSLFFQNQKIFVRGFSLPSLSSSPSVCKDTDSMRSVAGEGKELCGEYVHVHMSPNFQILVRMRYVFI